MPECQICGEEADRLITCKSCGVRFCEDCGSTMERLCEFCAEEEVDGDSDLNEDGFEEDEDMDERG